MKESKYLNSFGDKIFLLVTQDGKILQVSKNWETHTQLKSTEYKNSFLRNYIHPNSKIEFEVWLEQILDNKQVDDIDIDIQVNTHQQKYLFSAIRQETGILIILSNNDYTEKLERKLENAIIHKKETSQSTIFNRLHEIQKDFIHDMHSLEVYKQLGELAKEVTNSKSYLFVEYKNKTLAPIIFSDEIKRTQQKKKGEHFLHKLLLTLFSRSLSSGEIQIENSPAQGDGFEFKNFLSLPIFHGNETLGFLALTDSEYGYDAISLEKIFPIITTSGHFLYAFNNKDREEKLLAEISEYKTGLEALYEIILTTEENFDGQIEDALELGCEYLGLENAAIYELENDQLQIVHLFGQDPKTHEYGKFEPEHIELLYKKDARSKVFEWYPDANDKRSYVVGTYISMQKNTPGILGFYSLKEKFKPINSYQQHFMELLSFWLSQKIKEYRTNKLMRDQNFALNNSAIVVVMGPSGKILYTNDIYNYTSGYEDSELIDTCFSAYFDQGDSQNLKKEIMTSLQQGRLWQGEIKYLGKSGNSYWVNSTVVPFLDHQKKPYQYLSISFNITDRKVKERMLKSAKERAENAMHARSIFLSNMSHEIRTPLNAILGVVDLMNEENAPASFEKYLKVLKGGSENLAALIDDILDFSKIDSRKWKINKEWVDIKDAFDNLKHLFNFSMKEKAIDFSVSLNYDTHLLYEFDASSLNQILINLLSNAFKFTPQNGKVKLDISAAINEDKEYQLRFVVSDTGVGIPKEKQTDIFSPFLQVDSTYSKQHKGTGLGLAISQRLANLMGGKLNLKSQIGKGSEFTLQIPALTKDKPKHYDISIENRKESIATNSKAKILVVDDVIDNQFIVEQFLKKTSYNLDFANNGEEAISKYKKKKYDLVLMDIQMPGLDGLSATEQIRTYETANNYDKVPIIALSAYSLQEEVQKSKQAGCDEHLTKPVKKKILLASIEKWLNEYRKKMAS